MTEIISTQPTLNTPAIGNLCFHLAENKNDPHFPFAFLATYTIKLSKKTETQHLPLQRALQEFTDSSKKPLLLSLLLPIQQAAEQSVFIKNLVETGAIFQPLAWGPKEAYQFLNDIPILETAGIMARVPNWWDPKKPPRPNITVSIGKNKTSAVGLNALLDFDMHCALPSGDTLSTAELETILNSQHNLIQIKGQWINIDSHQLTQVLSHWKKIEKRVNQHGLTFAEGLRLLAGVSTLQSDPSLPDTVSSWSTVSEGTWLKKALSTLRNPTTSDNNFRSILKKHLNAHLRPYQEKGVQWLWWLYNMRLGGCLADDMGLGKTIQVLALLLIIKHKSSPKTNLPHLLILPASLLGNWQSEINRFASCLKIYIAHGAVNQSETKPALDNTDLVITTYGTMLRLDWLKNTVWDMVILDEAQAIKNPAAKQTQVIKTLNARIRFVLTGTPIENRLLDLWSLFDFIAPGLLETNKKFAEYSKKEPTFNASVRRLVNPYILRRLKSDKSIISDLPDKSEMQTYCVLTKEQVGLYQQAVKKLEEKLKENIEGIQRKGLVLSYLLRFKQICNHPCQWLGHGLYEPQLSGKFARLKELVELIVEKQEKVLIFTQFQEIIAPLCHFFNTLFGQAGYFLHGQIPIKERTKRVEAFQNTVGASYFVLSLKAGGTGLNLTAASHVIHFDRWWNPAVENQATDRAYRIGQKKNVLVHKFICQGTIEEKIDVLINSKKSLSNEILSDDGSEKLLTELSDKELLSLVALDINSALGEN